MENMTTTSESLSEEASREKRNTSSRKIAYLIPEFPGQTHSFFWREIIEINRLGVSPTLFSTRRPKSTLVSHDWAKQAMADCCYLWPPSAANFAIDVVRALSSRKTKRLINRSEQSSQKAKARLLTYSALGLALGRQMRRRSIDHLHVHSCGDAAYIARFTHLWHGITYSLTLHNPLATFGPDQPLKWEAASFAIVITATLRREVLDKLKEYAPADMTVAPMGVDVDKWKRPEPYDPWRGEGPLRIFSCGRLNPAKGVLTLLQAVSSVRREIPEVHLVIAGEDDAGGTGFRREVEAVIRENHLEDHVTLLGAVNEETVRNELAEAHLFTLASRAEPLGVVFMEAMCMQVPTIGTNAGGVPELIDHEVTGWLVPPDDSAALSRAIIEVVSNASLCERLSTTSRSVVEQRFSSRRSAIAVDSALGRIKK